MLSFHQPKSNCVRIPSLSKPIQHNTSPKYRTISLDNFMMPKLEKKLSQKSLDPVLNCNLSYTDLSKNKTKKMQKKLRMSDINTLRKMLKTKPNTEIKYNCVSDDGSQHLSYHSSNMMNMSHSHHKSKPSIKSKQLKMIMPKSRIIRRALKSTAKPKPKPKLKPKPKPKTVRKITMSKPKTVRKVTKSKPKTIRKVVKSKPKTVRKVAMSKPKTVRKVTKSKPKTVRKVTKSKPKTVRKVSVSKPKKDNTIKLKKIVKPKSVKKSKMSSRPRKSSRVLTREELNNLGEELLK